VHHAAPLAKGGSVKVRKTGKGEDGHVLVGIDQIQLEQVRRDSLRHTANSTAANAVSRSSQAWAVFLT
jgi:hypothetical protein